MSAQLTDRELLEFAAKAAGLKAQYSDNFGDFSVGEPYSKGEFRWNPLTDDGDALRLAVALSIFDSVLLAHFLSLERFNNPQSAEIERTRRAIVRAAAEIGKAMP